MKTFKELCPFREGSASDKIYMALASATRPMTVIEISKKAKVPLAKATTLCAAYFNPFHRAPLTRAGVEFVRGKDGIQLGRCKPNPKAKRPERGKTIKPKKKAKTIKAKRPATVASKSSTTAKPVGAQSAPAMPMTAASDSGVAK